MLFSHISTNFSDMITKIKNTPGLGLELDSYFHSASFEIYVPATPELLSKPIENNISQSHLAAIAAAVSSLLSCNNINPSDISVTVETEYLANQSSPDENQFPQKLIHETTSV